MIFILHVSDIQNNPETPKTFEEGDDNKPLEN